MSDLIDGLKHILRDEESRYAYVEAIMNARVAAQLKGLREQQGVSQEQLASMVGTRQSGISRLENANYSSWNVETLRKIARALGVRLRISFEEFGTLPDEIQHLSEQMVPRRFEEDPVFSDQAAQPSEEQAHSNT